MANDQNPQEGAVRSREVRLGVVMYGGVSLAIYIYGVAREFFEAVRGRGLFKLVKALTDSDVVVDVISGTSAGGINGILLAYCLTNELEFAEAASTWRDEGNIRALLRDPVHDPDPKSVLRGDGYFLPRLIETFARLAERPIQVTSEQGDPSTLPEVDLFVTGTDVDGRVETWIDAAGHPIDVKDHRIVFHLKHRAQRKEPLRPGWKGEPPERTYRALGKLARITSCFPGAFEPVRIGEPAAAETGEDALLSTWAWGSAGCGRDVFLVDGGVLDNKPFTSTIREIFYRLTERKVDRRLLYVEPDPEVFERLRAAKEPNLLRVVWGSLSTIPGYESTVADLKLLAEHNEQVTRFRRLVRHQRSANATALDGPTQAFIDRVCQWEEHLLEPPKETLASEDARAAERPSSYAQSRLVAISERVVQGMLRVDGRDTQLSELERTAAARLLAAYDEWPGSGDFTLHGFDVEFRMRRLFHTLYSCPKPPPGDGAPLRRFRYAFNRQTKLLEIVRNAMERTLDEGEFHWRPSEEQQAAWEASGANLEMHWRQWAFALWRDEVGAAFLFLLDVGGDPVLPAGYDGDWTHGAEGSSWLDQASLEEVHRRLMARVEKLKRHLREGTLAQIRPHPDTFDSLLRHTDDCERRILACLGSMESVFDGQPTGHSLLEEYRQFIRLDAAVFPLQSFAGLHEQDVIRTVRISPLDARRGFSCRSLEEKVSGDAVSHFGGFFKKSWRSNDILWGRLDGVCQLTETLLDASRVAEVMAQPGLRADLAARLETDLDPARLFPRSPAPTIATLRSWLADVSGDDDGRRAAALAAARFDEILGLLVEAQQLEILHDEVPSVIEDAVSEQTQWNSYRLMKREASLARSRPVYDADASAFFQRGDGAIDPLVAATASGALAQRVARRIRNRSSKLPPGARPSDTPFGLFFRDKYRVGSEELARDVPMVVLLEILSTVLLVARNCVVTLWGPRAPEVRKSAAYRIVSATLWGFDGMVALLAGGAGRVLGVMAALSVVSILALSVGIGWWTDIVAPDGHVKARWLAAFILVPAVVLLLEVWLLAQVAWRGRTTVEDPVSTHNPLALIPPRIAPGLIAVFALLAAGAFLWLGYGAAAEPGFQFELLQDPKSVLLLSADQVSDRRAAVLVDYGLLVAYSLALSLAALQLSRRLAARSSFLWTFGVPMAWLALLGGLVDATENAALLWLLAQPHGQELGPVVQTACIVGHACSQVKYVLPGIVIAYCVLAGVWSLFLKRALSQRVLRPSSIVS